MSVHARGLDPSRNPAITILHFADVLQRIGSFWLDSLNFRRETTTTGWRVDALLVFVDDTLVYQLVGGRPSINESDLRRNPLGPFQSWGEQSLRVIK